MSECDGNCGSCAGSENCDDKEKQAKAKLQERLNCIKHKVMVMSGKGAWEKARSLLTWLQPSPLRVKK